MVMCTAFIQGSSIALNPNTIAIHYALDLLRNLEKVEDRVLTDWIRKIFDLIR